MKINGNAIKPGNVIEHDGGLWVAVKTAHVKPGKGGAFAQVELKNLHRRPQAERALPLVRHGRARDAWSRRTSSYLYDQGDMLVFMDTDHLRADRAAQGLGRRGARAVPAGRHGGDASSSTRSGRSASPCPTRWCSRSSRPTPVVKGQTASSSYKPAKASNGMRIMIPPYMGTGEKVRGVDRDRRVHAPRRLDWRCSRPPP